MDIKRGKFIVVEGNCGKVEKYIAQSIVFDTIDIEENYKIETKYFNLIENEGGILTDLITDILEKKVYVNLKILMTLFLSQMKDLFYRPDDGIRDTLNKGINVVCSGWFGKAISACILQENLNKFNDGVIGNYIHYIDNSYKDLVPDRVIWLDTIYDKSKEDEFYYMTLERYKYIVNRIMYYMTLDYDVWNKFIFVKSSAKYSGLEKDYIDTELHSKILADTYQFIKE